MVPFLNNKPLISCFILLTIYIYIISFAIALNKTRLYVYLSKTDKSVATFDRGKRL